MSTTPDLRTMLQQTLQDQLLSRGERQAVTGWVTEFAKTPTALAEFHKLVFELAREELGDARQRMVLQWVEDLVRIQPQTVAAPQASTPEAWFSPGDDCVRRIVQKIQQVKQTLDVCVFTITDDRISEALVAAAERRVAIRIITDNEKAYDPGSDVERLRRAGIPLLVDETIYHMHHKFAIFDRDYLFTGSYNWTRGAARDNEENFILTGEPRLLSAFQQCFDNLWQALGKKQ